MAWTYRKTEPSDVRGICVACGKNQQKHKGKGKYSPLCGYCTKRRTETGRKTVLRNKAAQQKRDRAKQRKDVCERCGFIPEDKCQLDRDHIDGNHLNNDPSNHMTLCANCHRLKTFRNKDFLPRAIRICE